MRLTITVTELVSNQVEQELSVEVVNLGEAGGSG